jgi:hypothetical protein
MEVKSDTHGERKVIELTYYYENGEISFDFHQIIQAIGTDKELTLKKNNTVCF